MKKSITYVLLSVLFLCLCFPLGGCEKEPSELDRYKADSKAELEDYADAITKEYPYTEENLQRIKTLVADGKIEIDSAWDIDGVDSVMNDAVLTIDATNVLLDYNAEIIYKGVIREAGNSFYFKERFSLENSTLNLPYPNENYDPNDSRSSKYIWDTTSPEYRTHIITEQSQLEEVFIDPPQIDFEKEIIVIDMYSTSGAGTNIVKLETDGEKLIIGMRYFSSYIMRQSSSNPLTFQQIRVFKMDRINVTSAENEKVFYYYWQH